jgi:DNA-binding transcriptional regulator YiaG
MKTIKNKIAGKPSKAARSIMAGLQEILDWEASGEPLARRFGIRTIKVADPGEYGAAEITELRNKLGLSQFLFAQLVGASLSLIQSWEQGRRIPDGIARRLLDEIHRDPQRWAAMVHDSRTCVQSPPPAIQSAQNGFSPRAAARRHGPPLPRARHVSASSLRPHAHPVARSSH